MDDMISRQAAIDAAIEAADRWDGGYNYERGLCITEGLQRVPSVHPDFDAYCDRLWKAAYERGKRDAQANIVQCEDCKWRRNQNGTMAWIPCRALVTPDDFYCKYAERKEQ